MAAAFGIDEKKLKKMTPEELIQYFLDRLKEQTEAHHGGNRWIGTRGTSPVGHSGTHPEGMRVGGVSRNKSAIKVAMDRRWRDYSQDGPLTQAQMGEALKRLRRMVPAGPKDLVNVDKTIRETLRNAGEIEIVFDRRLTDRLKVILMIDNGGWSMEPFVELVQTLFSYARSQFKDLRTYYFHNSFYDVVWQDAQRYYRPERLDELSLRDPETRLIVLGDASMSPYELMYAGGAIDYTQRSTRPSIDRLKFLASLFRHAVWLNPSPLWEWDRVRTIGIVRQVFPMYELTLDGLEGGSQAPRGEELGTGFSGSRDQGSGGSEGAEAVASRLRAGRQIPLFPLLQRGMKGGFFLALVCGSFPNRPLLNQPIN